MKQPKKQIRIIGIDDCPFKKGQKQPIQVIGTVFRAGEYMDGLLSTKVDVDGTNATARLAAMINKSRNKGQLKAVMTDGIAVGGFNIVDIKELNKKTKLPVIAVTRKRPNITNIKKALRNLKNPEKRIKMIQSAGKIKIYKVS